MVYVKRILEGLIVSIQWLLNLLGNVMGNILFGIIFIVGGLSGNLALRGTNSGPALAAVGAGLLIWGIVQVSKSRSSQE